AVLQPRVSIHLASANRTRFSQVVAHSPGIDPYVTAASDSYQDLFAEGSFTGKGIYDLDAFEHALCNAFPENHILSHDLIECCHARAALVSDIELIDGFPARYDAESRRQHRWIRGDWQLLPWLFFQVPSAAGPKPNTLPLFARWRIFDNLRRSLVPAGMLLLLIVGWLAFPALAPLVTVCALGVLAFPLIVQLIGLLRGRPRGTSLPRHVQAAKHDLGRGALQILLNLTFLPHRASLALDAIGRTLVRIFVTRRGLLEWEAAAVTERRLSKGTWSALLEMWFVPVFAL